MYTHDHIVLLTVAVAVLPLAAWGADVQTRIEKAPKTHPRLLIPPEQWRRIQNQAETDPLLAATIEHIVETADAIEPVRPVQRQLKGRRMLEKSRRCLRRVLHLAAAARLTGRQKYVDRAAAEMLAAGDFANWNPSHFLDVAEMTAALAIGYDWLYDKLDEPTRAKIRQAIVNKGLKAARPNHWWVRRTNNWNQVCHGGLTLGALAVMEDHPELAQTTIRRAVENVPRAMAEYKPDGAYPEGPGYWSYGTSYNVMLIAALESALQTDFGLAEAEGFMESSDYYLHVAGPTGLRFNYADCGRGQARVEPAMYWFARRRDRPYLLFRQAGLLASALQRDVEGPGSRNRFFPLLLAWWERPEDVPTPPTTHFVGRGISAVGLHRNKWDPEGTYVGLKGGSPSANHGHMDIGQFVMDARGVRWAIDLGSQNYHSLESRGVDLWNKSQDSQRWRIFRLGSFSHNTLVVDDQLQRVKGDAHILRSRAKEDSGFTIIDMSEVYRGQLAGAARGAALRSDKSVIIQDELETLDRATTVRWGMVTEAEVTLSGSTATLSQEGKTLTMRVLSPENAKLEVYDTAKPRRDYDAANPGTRMLGFTLKLPGQAASRIVVHLSPAANPKTPEIKPLGDW